MTENNRTSESPFEADRDDAPDEHAGQGRDQGAPPRGEAAWRDRRLRRSHDQRLSGVAGGIAEYLDIDPTLVRLGFVILALIGFGTGVIAYGVLWLVLPDPDSSSPDGSAPGNKLGRRQIAGLVVGGLALALFADGVVDIRTGLLVPVVLIVGGLVLLTRRSGRDTSVGSAPGVSSPATSPDVDPPPPSTAIVPAAGMSAMPAMDSGAVLPPSMGAPPPPPPPPPGRGRASRPPKPPKAPKPPSVITPVVLSAMVVAAGVILLLDRIDALDASLAMVGGVWLLLIGVGLLVATFRGRAPGLVVIGILVACATLLARYVDPIIEDGGGERHHTVRSVVELEPEYRLGAGEMVVDLSQLDLDGQTTSVDIHLGVGELRVLLPDEPNIELSVDNDIGNAEVRDRLGRAFDNSNEAGIGNELESTFVGTDPAAGSLDVNVSLKVGQVVVTRVP